MRDLINYQFIGGPAKWAGGHVTARQNVSNDDDDAGNLSELLFAGNRTDIGNWEFQFGL